MTGYFRPVGSAADGIGKLDGELAARLAAFLVGIDLEQIHRDAADAGAHLVGMLLEQRLEFFRRQLGDALRPGRQLAVDPDVGQLGLSELLFLIGTATCPSADALLATAALRPTVSFCAVISSPRRPLGAETELCRLDLEILVPSDPRGMAQLPRPGRGSA